MNETTYVCQWCKGKGSVARRAPTFRMGSSMFEQWVCTECYTKAKEKIDSFWSKCCDKPGPRNCQHCDCELAGKEFFKIQRACNGDGSWSTDNVCRDCFCTFEEDCKCTSAEAKK